MGSEYLGPLPDPDEIARYNTPASSASPEHENTTRSDEGRDAEEPVYREHATGQLPGSPPQQQIQTPYASYPPGYPYAPYQPGRGPMPQPAQPHPGWRPYAAPVLVAQYPQGQHPPYPAVPPHLYPGYPGMSYPYGGNGQVGYYPYPYGWYPYAQRRKRDGRFALALTAFIGSLLAILGGLFSLLMLLFFSNTSGIFNSEGVGSEQVFSSIVLFAALGIAGLVGGGFSCYHSARAAFSKHPSIPFRMPSAWIFFALYILLITLGFALSGNQQLYENQLFIIVIIFMAGTLPALGFLALAVRRVRASNENWPTTWRRLTLALTSGATSALLVTLILELVLVIFTAMAFQGDLQTIFSPDFEIPDESTQLIILFITVAIIAPLVEELAKPIAVGIAARRLFGAAEFFVLGFASGIGFNLVETASYISSLGPEGWIDIALQRSTAGLLHGFGAGMVGLCWYYWFKDRTTKRRILIGLGCMVYAILQHAIWNGTFVLGLLPEPVGPYLAEGVMRIGSYDLPAILWIYLVESLLMFAYFLYVTKRIRAGQLPFPVEQTNINVDTGGNDSGRQG